MTKCTGCGIALRATSYRDALEKSNFWPDCWPLCSSCCSSWPGSRSSYSSSEKNATQTNRTRIPDRRRLIRTLYAAGRSLSCCHSCTAETALEVHFIRPILRIAEESFGSANLLLLCPSCHDKVHSGAVISGATVSVTREIAKSPSESEDKK